MLNLLQQLFFIIAISIIFSCKSKNEYEIVSENLSPLYPLKISPKEDDWLYTRKDEYQSLDDYIKSNPTSIDSVRTKIYIMLIGNFDEAQKDIVSNTADYLHAFYGLETAFVVINKDADIFEKSRTNPSHNQLQLSAKQLMNNILKPQLPKDAATLIGFTTYDLYPGNDWNYIFGLGSVRDRVGVWSMYRFGDPHKSEEKELCLERTIKTATHEIGHMFSMLHCAKYECCMNGSNTLSELTSHPAYFCPNCLAKICWNLKHDPKKHLNDVKKFWDKRNNKNMADPYNKSLKVL